MNGWPSKILLRFLRQATAIQKLLVFLLVKSPFRNDFPLGFFLTDSSGIIVLSREDILNRIEKAKKDSPMDYDGDLDDCSGLEIVIDSAESLDARIHHLKHFYPTNAEEIQKHAAQSCNKDFQDHKVTAKTPLKEEIIVEIS